MQILLSFLGGMMQTAIWPIGGGKGGTGKSFLTGNLGILLAKQNFKTLVIDGDFGAPNLHTIIGVPDPEKSISDFINKRVATLEETILATPLPALFLISGARNKLDASNLAHEQKMKVLRAISKLQFDYILIDLGAGTSFNTIDFFTVSNSGIFVTTPEPTSIENIYRLFRSVYVRKIRQILKTHGFKTLADEAEQRNKDSIVNSPEYLVDLLRDMEPEKAGLIEDSLHSFKFKLILNQMRKRDNVKLGNLICKIIERHLCLDIEFLGNVSFDDRVHDAVCSKGSFIERYPYTQTALDLHDVIKGIISIGKQRAVA